MFSPLLVAVVVFSCTWISCVLVLKMDEVLAEIEVGHLKITLCGCWYDFWVLFYYDRKKKILYWCPWPTFVIAFSGRDTEIVTG